MPPLYRHFRIWTQRVMSRQEDKNTIKTYIHIVPGTLTLRTNKYLSSWSYRPCLANLKKLSTLLCKTPSPLLFIFFFFSFSSSLLLLLIYHHNIGSICHELHWRLSSSNVLVLLQTELSTTMMIITLMRMRMMGRTSISPRSITGKWPSAIYLLSDPKCELSLGSETYDGGGLDGDWALPYCSSGPWLEGHWPDPRPSRNGLGGITLSEKCCAICSVFRIKEYK